MCTYIPMSPPFCVSLPLSLSHPSRWSQSTQLISLCDAAASHQLSVLHLVVYICQCYSLISSQLTLPPPRVLKCILCVCVFIPVLPLDTIKLLEENIGRTLCDINHSKILFDPPLREMEIKIKINKWDLMKLKSFCIAKETINKTKR